MIREKYPRIQLLTIEGLLGGERLEYPGRHLNITMRRAPKARERAKPWHLPFADRVAEGDDDGGTT